MNSLSRTRERAAELASAYRAQALRDVPALSRVLPEQISGCRLKDDSRGYRRFPETLWRGLFGPSRDDVPRVPEAAARYIVAEFIAASPFASSEVRIPDSVRDLYPGHLDRILSAVESVDQTLELFQDRWRKNLLILSGGLLPVGAELADPYSGIPRRLLVSGGPRQSIRFAAAAALQTRGFKPCFELHMHPDRLDDFNPAGWLATYGRLAQLLALNPAHKAVIAASWFRDPALREISPRLSYLRDYPEAHGALFFLAGHDRTGQSGALSRSSTRMRLFRSGAYVPKIHMMIWPRQELLAWHAAEGSDDLSIPQ